MLHRVIHRAFRPAPSRAPRPCAQAQHDDKKRRIDRLNSLFYENCPMLSGDELSVIIYARFGRVYRPDIVTRSGRRYLVLSRTDDEPGPSEMIHFNKVAEVINSEGSPDHVKRAILNTENAILGCENIEIPI